MTIEGETPVEGPWVDRVNGLERVQVDIVMMRTPDGHGRLELTKFRHPKLPPCDRPGGLASMYEGDHRFRQSIDKHGEGLTSFLAEAIRANAARHRD